MATEGTASETCPECGAPLRQWPMLDGSGHVVTCTQCDYELVVGGQSDAKPDPSATPAPSVDEEGTKARFRRLLSGEADSAPGDWPESLLSELPEDTQRLLSARRKPSRTDPRSDGTFRSDVERRLKEHGYYLAEDGRGMRLTGEGPRPGTGDLSPLDVVRLAADLEGGAPPPEQRTKCPQCDAVISTSETRCPWCGHQLSPPPESDPPPSP